MLIRPVSTILVVESQSCSFLGSAVHYPSTDLPLPRMIKGVDLSKEVLNGVTSSVCSCITGSHTIGGKKRHSRIMIC